MPRKSAARSKDVPNTTSTARPSELAQRAMDGGQSAVLLPYQQYWMLDTARVKVFEKSRRIGATWATAACAVLEAASGVQDVWYVNYNEEGGKEFIIDVARWCERFQEPATQVNVDLTLLDDDGSSRTVRALRVVFASGKRITALSSNPRGLRGKQGLVIVDEAAFIDDLGDVLKSAFAFLMWGGEVHIMSTHNGAGSEYAEVVNDTRDGKKDYSLHRCSITDALSEGFFTRAAVAIGVACTPANEAAYLVQLEKDYGEGAREELHVEPDQGGTAYLDRQIVKNAMYDAPVLRFSMGPDGAKLSHAERAQLVDDWMAAELEPALAALASSDVASSALGTAIGVDVGRTRDLTVIVPLVIEQNLVRRAPFMVELDRTHFEQQWRVLSRVRAGIGGFRKVAVDATGEGSYLGQQAVSEFGDDKAAVHLTIGYYRDNMPNLKKVLEDGTIKIPRDADVLADLTLITRVNGVPRVPDVRTDSVSSRGRRRHGDSAVALLLANTIADELEREVLRWNALSTL